MADHTDWSLAHSDPMARIIQANLEHLYWIRLLWEMFLEEKPVQYPDMRDAVEEFTTSMARTLQNPQLPFSTFLAFKGHKAIGFITGEIRYRPIGSPHYHGYIKWVYVHPKHRDKNVATDLALAWIEWLQEQRIQPGLDGKEPIRIEMVEGSAYYGDDYWKQHGFKPYMVTYVSSISKGLANKAVVEDRTRSGGIEHQPQVQAESQKGE